jgi:hypothetical protein
LACSLANKTVGIILSYGAVGVAVASVCFIAVQCVWPDRVMSQYRVMTDTRVEWRSKKVCRLYNAIRAVDMWPVAQTGDVRTCILLSIAVTAGGQYICRVASCHALAHSSVALSLPPLPRPKFSRPKIAPSDLSADIS